MRTADRIPPDLLHDLQAGRLSQRCPAPGCPVIEAAGFYSTCHGIPTGPADWFAQTRGRPASAPQKMPENRITRGRGRPRAHPGGPPVLTPPVPPVDGGLWP